MIEIKPMHDDIHCCLEDTFISLTNWLGSEYALMYAKSWDFGYRPSSQKTDVKMGNRIIAGGDHCCEAIEQYHGIKIKWHYMESAREMLAIAREEIMKGHPVLVCIDAFWLPWAKTYKIMHAKHFILITDVEDDDSLICIDPFITKEIGKIPFDHFENGNGKCIRLSYDEEFAGTVDWKEVVRSAIERTRILKGRDKSSFEDMRVFANDVEMYMDIEKEVADVPVPFLIPLYFQLRYVGMGRTKFSKSLEYLCDKFNIEELKAFSKRMFDFGEAWMGVRQKLMDAREDTSSRKLIHEAAEAIRKIADEEERFAEELLEFVNR